MQTASFLFQNLVIPPTFADPRHLDSDVESTVYPMRKIRLFAPSFARECLMKVIICSTVYLNT